MNIVKSLWKAIDTLELVQLTGFFDDTAKEAHISKVLIELKDIVEEIENNEEIKRNYLTND